MRLETPHTLSPILATWTEFAWGDFMLVNRLHANGCISSVALTEEDAA